ncbi:MAG: TRAP transporter small permease [Gracilibacteraceae bacterium]|jgi:TRAP-type C4-dicarboxylate transport system permease small subunit|nr:TRAP transporter small permease [Gracilibacteraceae bacterium]
MKTFRSVVRWLNGIMEKLAYVFIVFGMFIVTLSVVMRILFRHPIPGLTDIVSLTTGLIVAFSLTVTENNRKHLQVDFVREYFPPRLANAVFIIMHGLAVLFVGLVGSRFVGHFAKVFTRGDQTMMMGIPFWPVSLSLLIGLTVYLITMIINRLLVILTRKEGEAEP